MAIQSFSDKYTKEFFTKGKIGKGVKWKSVAKVAQRKLDMLHYAAFLEDLKSPPNNRLEVLKGDLKDFHSIRINDQWRIVFKWTTNGAEDVRIVDYHK
ncbi:MAG: type II toxin-antitoxin system RelE/ParE family toxin [Bdellovibrionales bacterium]|nr:type II toxin-antitoxin system RelE/ParE family toxin [Bdellovibrionales bacterium]